MNVSSANTNSCSLSMAHGIPLILVNAIVCVLGSLGNVLVCLAIATNSRLRRASNYLLFSLAIADLIMTLICEPILLKFISQLTFFHKCRTSTEGLVYDVLTSLSCQTSFLHLASISIDRFVSLFLESRSLTFRGLTSRSLTSRGSTTIGLAYRGFTSKVLKFRGITSRGPT